MKRNEILKDLMRDVYKRQSSVRAFRHFFIKYLQDQLIEGRFIGIELLKNLTHLNQMCIRDRFKSRSVLHSDLNFFRFITMTPACK